MGLFDELSKKLTKAGQDAVVTAKNFAETTKLNSQISDEKERLNACYVQIGRAYYERHADSQDNEFAEACKQIAESEAKIASLEEEVKKIRGVQKCPVCGADVPNNSKFCSKCGAVIEQAPVPAAQADAGQSADANATAPAEAAPEAAAASATIHCPNCNAEMAANMTFCTECGSKLQ